MELGIELTIIALFSLLGSVLAVRFRQPAIIGVLLVGAILGPNALGIVKSEELLKMAIEAGGFLLLFLIGLEFSLSKLLKSGVRVFLIATTKLGIVFLLGFSAAHLFGLDHLSSILVGVIFSITSTVIFLKILEQKGLAKGPEVELLIGVLILEDIFGVFALTFFSSFDSASEFTLFSVLAKIAISLGVLSLIYFYISKRIDTWVSWLTKYSTKDTFLFISIGMAMGLGAIAHLIGLSAAVGAFLAGNLISSLKNAEQFEKPMHPFIFVFTSLFFFSIGAIVDFEAVWASLGIILVFTFINIFAKLFATGFSMYLFSPISGRGAVFAGISMVSVGEFSLLLAEQGNSLVSGLDLVSITAAVIFLSSLFMASSISHADAFYSALTRLLPKSIIFDLDTASHYLRNVSKRVQVDKERREKIRFEWSAIVNNLFGIIFILGIAGIFYHATKLERIRQISDAFFSEIPLWIILLCIFGVLLFPTFKIFRNFRHLLHDFLDSMRETYPKEIANTKKIYRNLILMGVLFISSITLPALASSLGLKDWWWRIGLLFLVILIFLFLHSESIIKKMEEHHHAHITKEGKKHDH